MLLSLRYRFLFIHIAKTGGTSVRRALGKYRWRDPWYYPQWFCHRISAWSGHRLGVKLPRHAKAICAQEMLPRELFDYLFKFAFVRNPWDLQVSSYHHLRRERPALIAHCQDFTAFLQWKLDPERAPQYHADMTATPQTDFLVDLHGNMIVDFVGRYENLESDFLTLCRRLQLPATPLPRLRKANNRRDYRDYYNDTTAELVADRYAEDIRCFGYRFDMS